MNIASGVLFVVAFLPYIWAIVNHQTVPSLVSWAIWASVDTLAFLAMKKEKALNGQIIGAVAGAVTSIILWQKTGNAVLTIIYSQVATFAGAVPTFVGGYTNPSQENPIAWSIWLVSCVCALFAIKKWDLANALQPLTFTAIETVMVILVVVRPHLP